MDISMLSADEFSRLAFAFRQDAEDDGELELWEAVQRSIGVHPADAHFDPWTPGPGYLPA